MPFFAGELAKLCCSTLRYTLRYVQAARSLASELFLRLTDDLQCKYAVPLRKRKEI